MTVRVYIPKDGSVLTAQIVGVFRGGKRARVRFANGREADFEVARLFSTHDEAERAAVLFALGGTTSNEG